jgi:ATP-dependent helicase/nuclease subunit B
MRWGIAVDDTAGIPLNRTPVGIFLRHIMQVVAENFAPVPLLALLKHPLCRCGYTARQINALARVLDKYVLRGMQPYNGLLGYHTAIENAGAKMYGPRLDADQAAALHALIDAVQQAFQPLLDVFDPSMLLSVAGEQPPVALDVCVAAHVQVAELLADTVDDQTGAAIPGSTRLWVKDAGETAANFVADVLDAAPDMNAIAAVYYAPFFETLLKGYTVRPRFGLHPRVHILGPMEGRFLRPDVLVLGGVNEGVWPAYPSVDPWMSRPMRRDFGLPMPEWHIGQSAHDFVQAFCAPQVFITRAEKIANTPTVPSRWLLRLDAVLSGAGIAWPQSDHAHWAGVWDYPAEVVPMAAPEPRPPAHVRPRRYSATAVETLITDPYSIYASKILRLQPLEPLDEAPTRTYYGNLVHAVFEQFFKEHPKELPDNAAALCHSIAAQVFAPHMERPVVWAMWWPRMQRSITHFFITEEQLRSEQGRWVFTEQSGEWQLPGTDIRLSARSDRIDVLNDGTAHIIDYKTGTPPSMKSVRSCEAAQLPIAAILLEEGAFSAIPVRTVSRLSYWHIVPKSDSKKALSTNIQAEAVPATIRDSRENLRALLVGFADAATPYLCEPHAGKTLRYNKYTHLARVQEWAICGEDE